MKHQHRESKDRQLTEFRLIRALGVDCNAHRLRHYCKQLRRQADMQRWLRKDRLKRATRRAHVV